MKQFWYNLFFILVIIGFSPKNICNPINISGAAKSILSPTIITKPGNYRLAQDIVGTVTIDSDTVVFDLENRCISGGVDCISVSNHQDIIIKNGSIAEATSHGILISTCSNIQVHDIDFVASPTGLLVQTSTCINVEDCTFRSHTQAAIVYNNVNNGVIDKAKAIHNMALVGVIDLTSCFNCSVSHSQISENSSSTGSSDGGAISIVASQDTVVLKNFINNNTSVGAAGTTFAGIRSNNSNKTICKENIIQDNQTQNVQNAAGIFVEDDTNDCIVKNKIMRIISSSPIGLFLRFATRCFVLENIVKDSGIGFANVVPSNNVFFANQAQGNGVAGGSNYLLIPGPITTFDPSTGIFVAIPTAFDNISVILP